MCDPYGIELSHFFDIPDISNETLVFQSKYLVFPSKTFDFDRNTRYQNKKLRNTRFFTAGILNTRYFERNTQYFKKGVKSRGFSGFYVDFSASSLSYSLNICNKLKQPKDIIIFSVPAIQSKFQVFKILGFALEIPQYFKFNVWKTQYFKISDSKYLVFQFQIPGFHLNTRYFENM